MNEGRLREIYNKQGNRTTGQKKKLSKGGIGSRGEKKRPSTMCTKRKYKERRYIYKVRSL
jgi:hypothetical protein